MRLRAMIDAPAARIRLILAVALLGMGASPTIAGAESSQVSVGPIQTLAHVPYPGNPGAATIDGNTMWVDSSGVYDRAFDGYSAVFAYDLNTGQLQSRRPNPITVSKPPVAAMGLAGIALDAAGRLYIADMNGQGVLRLDPRTNAISLYGSVPTSTSTSLTAMPTFEVFGPDGSLYVSDASAPVIWRVPPGGGRAQPWFADPRLAGYTTTAVDGIAIDPSGRELYLATGAPADIRIYRLPLAHPDAAHLQLFHTYHLSPVLCTDNAAHVTGPNGPAALLGCLGLNIAGAGGIVFGKSGRLYVSLLPVAQLSILSPGGHELLRFPDPQQNMQLDNPVNAPFNLSLDGSGRLLIADNGDPSNGYGPGQTPLPGGVDDSKSWAILAVQVHDTPGRLFRPALPSGHGNPRPLKRPPSKNGNHLPKKKKHKKHHKTKHHH